MKKVWNCVQEVLANKAKHLVMEHPDKSYTVWQKFYNKMLAAQSKYFSASKKVRELQDEYDILKWAYGSWDSGILCEGRIRLWAVETELRLAELTLQSTNMSYEVACTDLKYWKVFSK